MTSPVHDFRREAAALQKIPLFNPRFREVYRSTGIVAILVIAAAVFALGIWWLEPWNIGYTLVERRKVWFGAAVMPFAAGLASSYAVEFVLKAVHLSLWTLSGALKLTNKGKVVGWVAVLFLGIGLWLSFLGGDWDLWGYLSFFLAILPLYCFVIFAWEETDKYRRPKQRLDPTAPTDGGPDGP
jgi:hypothetical protein